ncbi:MAG TPA: hypothetical protein VLG28_04565 [Acidimicrobiia bacterium]|jgi:hypothetical protein|nr:hypothetical protein [Acidimicrobiia bacterium]
MTSSTRLIGLSLGADLCWPQFYEDIVARLDPRATVAGKTLRFGVERVTIEPFDLNQPVRYDLVLDRLTPWYHTSREWIKKAVVKDDLYVLNNPFTLQAMQKHTSYAAMMRLGVPVPQTYLLPPKEYDHADDLHVTLERYAQMFDLDAIGEEIGFPMFLKPYDGGAWVGVSRIEDAGQLKAAYDASGTRIMHAQRAVEPFDLFVRCLAVGPQVNVMRYDPDAPLHDRYKVAFDFVDGADWNQLADLTLTINTFFGWDFNSCEALRQDGVYHPIDFANANPDSQVTSLHFHIPWLVKALIRWSLFCAATRRPMRHDLNWHEFFATAEAHDDHGERLAALGSLARRRLEADRFAEFCDDHLADLDEITLDYFATERAKGIIRHKVETMFPAQEVDQFTEHFWGLIQFWRRTERDRLDPS